MGCLYTEKASAYIKQRRMRRSANLLYFFVVPVLFFSLRKFRKQNRYK